MDKSDSKKGSAVANEDAFLTEVQWDTSNLQFVQNKALLYVM